MIHSLNESWDSVSTVSYTHLDVYKRQDLYIQTLCYSLFLDAYIISYYNNLLCNSFSCSVISVIKMEWTELFIYIFDFQWLQHIFIICNMKFSSVLWKHFWNKGFRKENLKVILFKQMALILSFTVQKQLYNVNLFLLSQ